jgi:hypothetical protein
MLPAPAPGARPLGRTGGPGREGRTPTDGRTLGPQAARREREVFVYFDKRRDGSCPVQRDALARGLGAHDLPAGRGENMSPYSASGHPQESNHACHGEVALIHQHQFERFPFESQASWAKKSDALLRNARSRFSNLSSLCLSSLCLSSLA